MQISRSRHYLTLHVLETVRDTEIVTINYYEGLTPFSMISNDPE